MTNISSLGKLTNQTNWRGSISAASMIASGFTSQQTVDDSLAQLPEFFVAADNTAEARCIDGRGCSSLPENHMGAQLPGGTPGGALAYRLGMGGDELDTGTFNDDARFILERSLALGFVPGDHRDTHGHGIGCGAIDKMDAALAAMVTPELAADHKRLVKTLLGNSFSDELYMHILDVGVTLMRRIDEYMQEREKSIVELESTLGHPVSMLQGDHHECLVIINTVPGSTFATKRFSDSFKGIQAFNYDVWRTFEFADAVFEDTSLTGSKESFVMARVMTAVATLMVLTDGSQNLIVRS